MKKPIQLIGIMINVNVIIKLLRNVPKCFKIIVFFQDRINMSVYFDDITNDILKEFCHERCAEFLILMNL